MAELRLELLGSPKISVAGDAVATDRRKAVALLAYLAVNGAPIHGRDSLAALLWPDYDQSNALAYLRRTLWELNRMLGDGWLHATRDEIGLAPGANIWVDVDAFVAGTSAAAAASPADAILQLETAVALYQDEFMAGFSLRDAPGFDEWQRFQAENCRRRLANALATLSRLTGEQAQWDTAVAHARRWLTLDPLDEAAHRQLMQLYAGQGQRAAALRQYDTCVAQLQRELGVTPEPETQALADAIRRGERGTAAAPAADHPVPGNLPVQTTPFIGRETERAELARLLESEECRLLTLIGPGGIGKTRLALQTAVEQRPNFRDGVYFVPLASVQAPEQVVQAVASVLNLPFSTERETPRQQLLSHLRGRRALFVFDNYEHLLNGSQPFALDLLATAPHVKLLVTSRARLNVQGEQLYPLTGLPTPDLATAVLWQDASEASQYGAVQLFQSAAERVRPGFQLSPDNILFVARICELVQGMPLAIELAASWMTILSPMEIAVEIAQGLDFLETEMRDVPERQRSIRAVFDGSWHMLTPAEQAAFPRLSVLGGSFSREAAQAVAQASLRVLLGLTNKSLLFVESNGRFRLHELLRQYAAERLAADAADAAATQARFDAFFTGLLIEEGRSAQGSDQMTAVQALERDWIHVQVAWLNTLRRGQLEVIAATVVPLLAAYALRPMYQELFDLLDAGLRTFAPAADDRAAQVLRLRLMALHAWASRYDWISERPLKYVKTAVDTLNALDAYAEMGPELAALAQLAAWKDDTAVALELADRAVEQARASGDAWQLATVIMFRVSPLWERRELDTAIASLEEVVVLYRQCGSMNGVAAAIALQAMLLNASGQRAEALPKYEESQAIYEAQGNMAGLANNLSALASSLMSTGDYQEAMETYQASSEVYAAAGDRVLQANSLSWESITARQIGEVAYARQLREQAFAIYQELEDANGIAWSYWEFGEMARMDGRFDEARSWLEQSLQIFEQHNATRGRALYHGTMGDILLAEGDGSAAETHFEASLSASLDDNHFYSAAYATTRLGQVALRQGDLTTAVHWFSQAIQHASAWANHGIKLMMLTGLAQLALARGQAAEALRLAALIRHHPASYAETRERATAVADAARGELTDVEIEACERDGRGLDVTAVVDAYLTEMGRAG